MCAEIYGIDTKQKITPLMVRDAMIDCFLQAHCLNSGIDADEEGLNKLYCKEIVEKSFSSVGENFNQPTKEGILKVMDYLAEFSKNFRNQEIIKKHYKEIMSLVERL